MKIFDKIKKLLLDTIAPDIERAESYKIPLEIYKNRCCRVRDWNKLWECYKEQGRHLEKLRRKDEGC